MNYQIGKNNQDTAFAKGVFGNTGLFGGSQADIGGNTILAGNQIGDLLACKLVKNGNEPVLDINGVQIKTKAAQELENANEGDTIYLKIQHADVNQVSLKIVGVQSQVTESALSMTNGAQVMKNTEQFSEMIKENLDGALDEEKAKENQKEILRNLSSDEIAQLRMMQIDITNSTLSDLMGMVINIRTNEHQDEVNELIGDIAKDTMDKIKNEDTTQIVTDEQMIYLIKNNLELTIENLQTARNSVNEQSTAKELELDAKIWNDVYPQVSGIIEAAGMSVSEQSLSGAKFMLQHELPVTVESLRLYTSVNALNQRGLVEEQTKANIHEQITLGHSPEEARIQGSTLYEKAGLLMEKVQEISDYAIEDAVKQGKPLTIAYLYNNTMRTAGMRRTSPQGNTGAEGAQLSLSSEAQAKYQEAAATGMANPQAVSAKRQLEEIRLAMTLEAAVRLVNQDIHIDARPLTEVVDALREQENTYYDNIVSAHDLHDIPEGVDLLKETLKETEGLRNLPAYALGEMVKRPTITVGTLYENATRIKAILGAKSYETMMTRPRSDLGDSITEAFQNVDDILKDMDMDRNEENQRAVRILAYNQMELNEENITSVKAADAKVQQMFETLTPQVVLNLIRENKNPLNMTIDGLNEEIIQQKEILGVTDEQRFSEFLYQMDRNNAITDEERQSFIGIYRLLDKVEKSHGKDIGAVVRNGQEITLNNLFAADKSRKVQGMDVKIDEQFGARVDVETESKSILSQIETAYNQTLTRSILRHIRPETLKGMQDIDYLNMTFEELDALMKAGDTGKGETEQAEELRKTLQEALSYEEDVATMLEANDLPKTATNIIAAQQVLYGEDGIYGMIHDIKSTLSKENRDKITEKEKEILPSLESRSDIVYGLENIRSALSEAVHDKEKDGTITAMDIQSLKYLNAGMPIAMRAVSEDVFQIPLVVGEEVSLMKVSILQDGSKAAEITASMETSQYGALEAFIHLEGNQVEGYISLEDEKGQSELEANELTLRSVFAKAGLELKDLRIDGTKPTQYGSVVEKEEVSTTKLYQAAKQLLTAIKLTGVV